MALLRVFNKQNVAKKVLYLKNNSKSFLIFEQSFQNSLPVVYYSSSSHPSTNGKQHNFVQKKHASSTTQPASKDPLDLSFANPEAAFKSKTTWEVLRAYIMYQLCAQAS
uniref:Proline dehydrogenase 1, mitochondrial n=1 Tax=Cacopsylla melanoneura TaxID=428564 RepID=A0A8D8X617_9HEMI